MRKAQFINIFSLLMLTITPLMADAAQNQTCPQFESKVRKCQLLQGTTEQRAQNQIWRESHVPVLTPEDYGFTLVYIDESVERPIAAQLTGLKLQKVYEHEELLLESNCIQTKDEAIKNDELEAPLWAKVRLPDDFADLCDQGSAYLQVDDHLGAGSQVIAVQPQGILVRHTGRLYWLSVQPANYFPEFRMVWQSSYRIAPSLSHSGSKGKTRKKSNRASKPKRKKAKRSKKR